MMTWMGFAGSPGEYVALLIPIRLRGVGLVDGAPVIVIVDMLKRTGFSAGLPPGLTSEIDLLVVILQLWNSTTGKR